MDRRMECQSELREREAPDPLATELLAYWTRKLRLEDRELVYVLGEPEGSAIKIGVARDVRARIATLQIGNPHRLRLRYVLPGGRPLERALHRFLGDAHLHGEWFDSALAPRHMDLIHELALALKAAGAPGGVAPYWRAHYVELCKANSIARFSVRRKPEATA